MAENKEHLFRIYDQAKQLQEEFGGTVDTSLLEEEGRKLGVDLAQMRKTAQEQNTLGEEQKSNG